MKADELRRACRDAIETSKWYCGFDEYYQLDDGIHECDKFARVFFGSVEVHVESTKDGLLMAWCHDDLFDLRNQAGELARRITELNKLFGNEAA